MTSDYRLSGKSLSLFRLRVAGMLLAGVGVWAGLAVALLTSPQKAPTLVVAVILALFLALVLAGTLFPSSSWVREYTVDDRALSYWTHWSRRRVRISLDEITSLRAVHGQFFSTVVVQVSDRKRTLPGLPRAEALRLVESVPVPGFLPASD